VNRGIESSGLTCPNAMVSESKETTLRFVNVSRMAKLQPDASLTLSFLLPLYAAIEGLHDMILLNARDDLDVLSLWSVGGGVSVWCRQMREAAMFFCGDPSTSQWVDQHHQHVEIHRYVSWHADSLVCIPSSLFYAMVKGKYGQTFS
jgi:hypothetical protein